MLELVALGEPLGPGELVRLAHPSVVEALEAKGLITSGTQGNRLEIRLAHPVYGDVVRSGISALRVRTLSRSLADVIEAVGEQRQGDLLKVATLRLVGGGGSAELLLSGAMRARARHDYPLTERLARAASDAGAGFEARFFRGRRGGSLQRRSDQAEEELAALAPQATTDADKARVALLRFDNVFMERLPDFQIIDETLAAITDPFWRDELKNRRLFVTSIVSGPRNTMEVASTWSRHPDPAFRVAVGYALVRIGRLDEAIEQLTSPSGTAAVPAPEEPWQEWMLFGNRVAALISAGRLAEADELLTMAYRDVIDHPASEARAFVADWLAVLHFEQGRPGAHAFRRASESYTLYQQLGRSILSGRAYAIAAHALAISGRAEESAATLDLLDAVGPRSFATSELRCSRPGHGRPWPPAIYLPPGHPSRRRPTAARRLDIS